MIIVGVDPGGTTGMFTAQLEVDVAQRWRTVSVTHHEVGWEDFGDLLDRTLSKAVPLFRDRMVACERFVMGTGRGGGTTQQPDALMNAGVTRWLAYHYDAHFHMVTKSNAIKLASNDRLRASGWWGRGMTHSNDAARVAMMALVSWQPQILSSLVQHVVE